MRPRLSRRARLRPDPRDGTPVLLSPERGLRLGPTAAATVELCDGTRELGAIALELAARFGADPARVLSDVEVLVRDLVLRGLVEAQESSPDAPRPVAAGAAPGAAPQVETGDAERRVGQAPRPYTLVAELTHRCPLACPYCSNPRDLVPAHDELGTEEWTRVLSEAAALGVMQVHLSGGEPLARSDLEAVAAHARALDLYVNLVTGGVPLDRPRLDRLAPSLDHVQLSIQDADPASSDRIAGMRSHESKLRVARWVKDLGLPLTLNVVLHRDNLDRVADVVAMAEQVGADRLELANVQLVSWALESAPALLPTSGQLERARRVAEEARARLAGRMQIVLVLPDWHADLPRACMDGWGRRFVVVAPDGAVLPCHAARSLPLSFDSVRKGSATATLAEAWEGAALRALRGEDWMREPCRSCDRRGEDFGGCRCQAYALTGDLRATDPACALSPAHELVVKARARAEGKAPRWVHRGR